MHEYEAITEAIREVEPDIAEVAHPDAFLVVRTTRIPDGWGGHTDAEVIVDEGRCKLAQGGILGAEAPVGPVTLSISGYRVTLPRDVDLRPTDTLMVNARRFDVLEVTQGGEHSLFTKARLEEVVT